MIFVGAWPVSIRLKVLGAMPSFDATSSSRNLVLDPAVEAGAAGYVGVLTGVPWDTCRYYVPYVAKPRPLSGL